MTTNEELIRLAPSRATVLLVGGSPEAKATAARALHDASPRASHPFIVVDCTAVAPDVVERLLFGGAPYGARAAASAPLGPRGAVDDAERGTLYVANVHALPMALQPRLLRFLDDSYTVRVVASSDVDLVALAGNGRFRTDLGERLCLVCVDVSNLGRL